MPSGKFDKPVVTDNHDGTVTFKYDPKEVGTHELQIKYNLEHVQGSPYKFHVDTVGGGTLTAYGPGLVQGVAGEPSSITVSNKGNALGKIDVSVDGPSKTEVTCHDNNDGTMSITYVPPSPGDYKISIKTGGNHIRGSPFSAKITAEGRKRSQITLGHSSEVALDVQEKDIKCLNASIVAPSGLEEPCIVKKREDDTLCISFTPREEGEHSVNIKKLGNHLSGSPFKINVLVKDIGNASKVKVTGDGLKEGKTHTDNEFVLHTADAGYGGLNFSVEGRSASELKCEEKDGIIVCSYKPTEPGYYVINLKFADHHIPGSPFAVKVTGPGSNIIRETIRKKIDQVPLSEIGKDCRLILRLPGANSFDMAAKVSNPSAVSDDAVISDMEDCLYCIYFVPKEPGIHILSIKHKDMHIPGSPFQYTVGPIQNFGAHKIHAGGLGLERGGANEFNEFNLYTREAGPGDLQISVEGPSRAEMNILETGPGTYCCQYKVTEPGNYRIGIKFNDEPIPDSPFQSFMLPDVGDGKNIELGHVPDASALQMNKPIAFTIQMNGAKGLIDGKIVSPSGAEDDCFVTPMDEDSWALRFIPHENGIHQIHLRHNGTHIPQSPFRIKIGQDDADPAAVQVLGNGLRECKVGVKTDFLINTCNAGAGHLAVTIEGPSKVSMDCTEVADGYKVRYTPLAPGDYYVTIKYNSYHIVGSPFKVLCTGTRIAEIGGIETSSVVVETVSKQSKHKSDQVPKFRSDPNKITCKGPGLKKAITHKMNSFQVNCQDAGQNILFVSLYGPKGPSEELHVKHTGRNMFNVSYMIKDRGDHILIIKYGNDHIPGSPFKVECT